MSCFTSQSPAPQPPPLILPYKLPMTPPLPLNPNIQISKSLMNTATIPSTSSTPIDIEMDSRVWRHLPLPLLDRILALLPPPSFFRCRSLSKRFYSLLFSDSFLSLSLSLPSPPSFLFFPSPSPSPSPSFAFLFLPSSLSWHRLPLPRGSAAPSASSSGVLLFPSPSPGPKSITLFNPLPNLAVTLPPSLRPRLLPSLGLSVTPTSLTVLLAGDDMVSPFSVKNLSSELFLADASTGVLSPWSLLSPLPRLCSLHPHSPMASLRSGRFFYSLTSSPFAVLAFDVATNAWTKIQAPMRRFLRSPSLTVVDQKLVMVAAVEKRKLAVPRSVRVWELQQGDGGGWVEAERMPAEFHRQFEEAEAGRGFECVGSGEFLAVTVAGSADVVLFGFRRREWMWAPRCPFVGGGGLRGLAYEPRLATPALGLIEGSMGS